MHIDTDDICAIIIVGTFALVIILITVGGLIYELGK